MVTSTIFPGLFLILFFLPVSLSAQEVFELNSGWVCKNINGVPNSGEEISILNYTTDDWIKATVPGTVLTTLLNNALVPDPFYGLNNEEIPDIYDTGNDHYTYWFINDFEAEEPAKDEQIWLNFRGVNYACEIFMNGQKVNREQHKGMFLRQSYNITAFMSGSGKNRLAVIVYPPDPAGNAKTGQAGDGMIGRNVTHQYVAGWDWIQPVRDRTTGIWDKVTIERT